MWLALLFPLATAGVAVDADLRSEYLRGQPLLVDVVASNDGAESVEFPDITRRPHLVRFEIDVPGARPQVHRNTPPATDSDDTWLIPSTGQRHALLAIPGSSKLRAGDYKLTVHIGEGDNTFTIGPHPFAIAEPKPIGGVGPAQPAVAERVGLQSVWVHDSAAGAQLYLHLAEHAAPTNSQGTWFLADVADDTAPTFSTSHAAQAWARHVYWSTPDGPIKVVQLDGPGRAGPIRTLDLPWPGVQLLGTGVTDSAGHLHAPIWIPSPKGTRGEVRVMTYTGRGAPTSRKVARLDAPARGIATAVDGSNTVRIALWVDEQVDLYTLRPGTELPAAGVRTTGPNRPDAGTPLALSYAPLPSGVKRAGGLALYVMEAVPTPEGKTTRGRWIGSDGQTLHIQAPTALPAGFTIREILPMGADQFAALLTNEAGVLHAWSTDGQPKPIRAGQSPALVSDAEGLVWLRSFAKRDIAQWAPVASP
jgi:hypothetical protein